MTNIKKSVGSTDKAINHLVAEHVFDWKWASFLGHHYLLSPQDYEWNDPINRPGLGWKVGKQKGTEIGYVEERFIDTARRPICLFRSVDAYSTDIKEAWNLVRYILDSTPLSFVIGDCIHPDKINKHVFRALFYEEQDHDFIGIDESASRAICKAILEFKGVKL